MATLAWSRLTVKWIQRWYKSNFHIVPRLGRQITVLARSPENAIKEWIAMWAKMSEIRPLLSKIKCIISSQCLQRLCLFSIGIACVKSTVHKVKKSDFSRWAVWWLFGLKWCVLWPKYVFAGGGDVECAAKLSAIVPRGKCSGSSTVHAGRWSKYYMLGKGGRR